MFKQTQNQVNISAVLGEYSIPPLKDMLILGRDSPIGCIAMRRAIELLVKAPFEHIECDDEIISDILVRKSLLNRASREALIEFVIGQVKPLMSVDEILHAELDVSVRLSAKV